MSTEAVLCKKEDLASGEILKIEQGGLVLAVYNVDGTYFVTDDACTHGPGSLSEGYLEGHVVECDFHGGCFDVRDGSIVSPPCMIPLKTYEVVENPEMVVARLDG